jgi:hypothetical protein
MLLLLLLLLLLPTCTHARRQPRVQEAHCAGAGTTGVSKAADCTGGQSTVLLLLLLLVLCIAALSACSTAGTASIQIKLLNAL